MKKKSFFAIYVMAVALAATVAVVSCKKEKHDQRPDGNEQTVQATENMDEYLMSFKKKLLSAEKGAETISLEQAERDLGNLLNFDFGDANYATDVFRYDTLHAKLALTTDGQVDLSQLAVTYGTLLDEILDAYHQTDLPEKSVYGITCSMNNSDDKASEDLEVNVILTLRGLIKPSTKTSFDETDNWSVWLKQGKCDGTFVGDDHITMIQKVYNNTRPLLECGRGRIYYTDIVHEHSFNAHSFRETNPDIFYNDGYRLWCGYGRQVYSDCIEYPEMQYYYNNFCQIIANELPRPDESVIMSVDSCWLECYVSVNPQKYYTFYGYYTTGKPNCTDEPATY